MQFKSLGISHIPYSGKIWQGLKFGDRWVVWRSPNLMPCHVFRRLIHYVLVTGQLARTLCKDKCKSSRLYIFIQGEYWYGRQRSTAHTRWTNNSCMPPRIDPCIGHLPFAADVFDASVYKNCIISTIAVNTVIHFEHCLQRNNSVIHWNYYQALYQIIAKIT